MRKRVVITGALVLVLGVIVEVGGVCYANGVLQHNVAGFGGGILALVGIIALTRSQSTRY